MTNYELKVKTVEVANNAGASYFTLRNSNHGFGLVEVVVAAGVLSVVGLAFLASYSSFVKASLATLRVSQAAFLAEEGLEAVRFIRDSGWASKISPLSTGVSYYFAWESSIGWTSTTTPETVGIFSRSFRLNSVYRDGNSDIAASGVLDANARKITVSVSYPEQAGTTTKEISSYLTNLFGD